MEKKEKEKREKEALQRRLQATLNRTTVDDFYERLAFRQEFVAGHLTAFLLVLSPPPMIPSKVETRQAEQGNMTAFMYERLLTGLMNTDFSKREFVVKASQGWKAMIAQIIDTSNAEGHRLSLLDFSLLDASDGNRKGKDRGCRVRVRGPGCAASGLFRTGSEERQGGAAGHDPAAQAEEEGCLMDLIRRRMYFITSSSYCHLRSCVSCSEYCQ